MIVRCLLLTPDRVPHSLIVSQGTLLGGVGHSWSVQVFILIGNFPDGFPQDEDPVAVDGNPHAAHGQVPQGNADADQGWQHELHGAGQHVHADFGLNAQQMADVQEELQIQHNAIQGLAGWDAWPVAQQEAHGRLLRNRNWLMTCSNRTLSLLINLDLQLNT